MHLHWYFEPWWRCVWLHKLLIQSLITDLLCQVIRDRWQTALSSLFEVFCPLLQPCSRFSPHWANRSQWLCEGRIKCPPRSFWFQSANPNSCSCSAVGTRRAGWPALRKNADLGPTATPAPPATCWQWQCWRNIYRDHRVSIAWLRVAYR